VGARKKRDKYVNKNLNSNGEKSINKNDQFFSSVFKFLLNNMMIFFDRDMWKGKQEGGNTW
jgi:hypothetical protein